MSPAGDSGATGQTGSHNRSDRSSSDRPSEQTGRSDWSDQSNTEWLQQRIDHYQVSANYICEAIEDLDDIDKLGQGFTSADPLEKVDIVDGTIPRLTFKQKFVGWI